MGIAPPLKPSRYLVGGVTAAGGVAWRCYSPKCLTPDKKSYRNGSECPECACDSHQQLLLSFLV
jgi:hypothetical protein